MDQCQESVQNGLKQMVPECFVSVKLETYEEGSCSEPQPLSSSLTLSSEEQPSPVFVAARFTPQRISFSDDQLVCSYTVLKEGSDPSSTNTSYHPQHSSTMQQPQQQASPQQQQQQSTSQSTVATHGAETTQVVQSSGSLSRAGPPTHTFVHPHPRSTSEVSWISHSYVQDQGNQHFHSHQMSYLPNDTTLLASLPQVQTPGEGGIRILKTTGSPIPSVCRSDASASISAISTGEVSDSNAFINYVLNQQRGTIPPGGVFLFDTSRTVTPQSPHNVQQQSNGDAGRSEEAATLIVSDRPLEESTRNASPEAVSTCTSPKPGESHLVSRYCQTIVTMSQIQDAPLMPDTKIIITEAAAPAPEVVHEVEDSKDIEADGEDSQEVNSSTKTHKSLASTCTHFVQQRPTLNCQGQLNDVDPCVNNCGGNSKCVGDECLDCDSMADASEAQTHSESQGGLSQHKNEASSDSKNGSSGGASFPYTDIDRPFRCDICGKTYPTHQALVSHDRYHRGERPYECETCHKAFATNSHLVTHRRTHTGERPYQCHLCQRCFADRSAFVKHERTHGPNGVIIKRFKCEECGSGFVDSCGLKKHTRIHTGERPYICSVCEKSFSTSSTYVAHKRIHTGERPYKCESCDKMFITKSHLLTHRRTHTGEKPFTCSVCNRCFADGSSFRRHERLHTGENRHICNLCGRGFALESSLERHKLTHPQSGSFSYLYENRTDLSCVPQQQPPPPQPQQSGCDLQSNRTRIVTHLREAQTEHTICVDLSREIAGDVQVNRSNMCAVASRDIDCDNQNNHTTIMVPAREIA